MAKQLRTPPGAELHYQRALTGAMRVMHADAMAWLEPKLDQLTRQDDKRVSRTQLSSEFVGHVDKLARDLAAKVQAPFARLAAAAVKQNTKAMASLGLDVRGQLGPALEHMREWNQRLMLNAGKDYANDVAEVLDDPDNFGLRHEELAAKIHERAGVSESRAELIARDQSAKTAGSINQFRQRNAGVSSYTWSGSLDERERETHLANEGKEFRWDDPPAETGHPTEDVQCRCVAIPVIPALDEEESAPAGEGELGAAPAGAASAEPAEEPEATEPERIKDPRRAEAGRKGAQRLAERNLEIHSYVKSNLPPELHPIWEREGRAFMQRMGSHAGLDPAQVKALKEKGTTRYRQAVAERASQAFLEHAQLSMEEGGGGDFGAEVFRLSEAQGEEAIAKRERELAEHYEAEAKARGDVDEHGQLTAQGRERAAREQAELEALDREAAAAEASREKAGFFDDLLGSGGGDVDEVPF